MKSPLQKHIANLDKEKPKPKVIGTYLDPKYGVPVKVYAGNRIRGCRWEVGSEVL